MRRITRRLALQLGAAVPAFIALTGRAPAASPIVLRRSNGAEPDSLDPHKSSGTWEANIIGDMMLGLMTEDMKGVPTYGTAESYTISPDGLVYTFKIRQGMTWSDGMPVTASDCVFGLQRILNPKTAAQFASLVYPVKNAQAVNTGKLPLEALGARAIDARTLEITLESPTPYFINLLVHHTTFPVPKHAIEKFGDAWVKPGKIVVNGAYTLAEWVPNSVVRLVRNPRFYDAASVRIDEVHYIPLSDNSVSLKRFRAGELDTTNDFPAREYRKLKAGGYPEIKPSEVHACEYAATTYIQFNNQHPPFNDPRVRRALSLAIDREVITDKIMGTGQIPAYALVPPGMAHYSGGPQLDFKTWPMDKRLAEARRLLAAAGFGPDHPLTFDYRYRDNPDIRRVAIAYQAMWRAIGANARLLNSETAVHYNALRTQDFEVADAGWVADFNDAQSFLFVLMSNSGQMNYGKYANPHFDALLNKASQTLDPAERTDLMRAAETIELQDQPIVPVFFSVSRSLVRDYVKGWEDNVFNWHRTRYLRIERS